MTPYLFQSTCQSQTPFLPVPYSIITPHMHTAWQPLLLQDSPQGVTSPIPCSQVHLRTNLRAPGWDPRLCISEASTEPTSGLLLLEFCPINEQITKSMNFPEVVEQFYFRNHLHTVSRLSISIPQCYWLPLRFKNGACGVFPSKCLHQ